MTVLNSPRLQLRPWRESDLAPFVTTSPWHGKGRTGGARVGTAQPRRVPRLGWNCPSPRTRLTSQPASPADRRLKSACRGPGYATEAARESLRFAFENHRRAAGGLVHRPGQSALARRDAAARHDARPRRGLRASGTATRPSAAPAGVVPSGEVLRFSCAARLHRSARCPNIRAAVTSADFEVLHRK
jgi:hypothetical protein